MRVLVTGATGFVGRTLLNLLLRDDCEVIAASIPDDVLAGQLPASVTYLPADICDPQSVNQLVSTANPHYIIHLAGMVRGRDLASLLAVNVHGTDYLLDAASRMDSPPRVVVPGSAAEYGLLGSAQPIQEKGAFRPNSNYGVSKVAQTMLALSYAYRRQVDVVIGRIFNITGPGEPDVMLGGAMAAQIAQIEQGQNEPVLSVGNLSPTRDYVDVRDAVAALWLLAQHGESGHSYNISSGTATVVGDVVRQIVALSSVPIDIQPDLARQRPSDIPHMVGSPDKLKALGWQPKYELDASLQATLDWWRKRGANQL